MELPGEGQGERVRTERDSRREEEGELGVVEESASVYPSVVVHERQGKRQSEELGSKVRAKKGEARRAERGV
jgi:hypothetical protein